MRILKEYNYSENSIYNIYYDNDSIDATSGDEIPKYKFNSAFKINLPKSIKGVKPAIEISGSIIKAPYIINEDIVNNTKKDYLTFISSTPAFLGVSEDYKSIYLMCVNYNSILPKPSSTIIKLDDITIKVRNLLYYEQPSSNDYKILSTFNIDKLDNEINIDITPNQCKPFNALIEFNISSNLMNPLSEFLFDSYLEGITMIENETVKYNDTYKTRLVDMDKGWYPIFYYGGHGIFTKDSNDNIKFYYFPVIMTTLYDYPDYSNYSIDLSIHSEERDIMKLTINVTVKTSNKNLYGNGSNYYEDRVVDELNKLLTYSDEFITKDKLIKGKFDKNLLNKYTDNEFIRVSDIKYSDVATKPTDYGTNDNVVNCKLSGDRYGYYSGDGLTRLHLGDDLSKVVGVDIQACIIETESGTQINWNHWFNYYTPNNPYKYVSLWIDDECILNKDTIEGTGPWNNIKIDSNKRTKWINYCDGKYHELYIRYHYN